MPYAIDATIAADASPFNAVFVQGGAKNVPAFEAWAGRRFTRLHDFAPHRTQADLALPDWFLNEWRSPAFKDRMVITLGMLPADRSVTLQQAAAGALDAYFRRAGQRLVAAGIVNPILRLGHEGNGKWSLWYGGNDPVSWRAAFQRQVDALLSASGNRFEIEWCMSAGWTGLDPVRLMPIKGYVDRVSVDFYDSWYGHPGESFADRWRAIQFPPKPGLHAGLDWWVSYVGSLGLPLSVRETGLVNADAMDGAKSRGGGGDDPEFLSWLNKYARDHGIAEVCYQNATARDGDHYLGPGATRFPRAAAAFRELVAA